jgi:hypothetical protein
LVVELLKSKAARCKKRTLVGKAHRILFAKYRKYEWKYAKEVASSSGVQVEEHKLEKMAKRRSCIVCSYNFKEGIKTDRRNPKLTQFECTTCTPATALCGPQ